MHAPYKGMCGVRGTPLLLILEVLPCIALHAVCDSVAALSPGTGPLKQCAFALALSIVFTRHQSTPTPVRSVYDLSFVSSCGMSDIDLFDQWFRIADKDRNGLISGQEAVEFFQRSNLPQDTLFQVLQGRLHAG